MVVAGNTRCFPISSHIAIVDEKVAPIVINPPEGNSPRAIVKSIKPNQNGGIDQAVSPVIRTRVSILLLAFQAASIPRNTPKTIAIISPVNISKTVGPTL